MNETNSEGIIELIDDEGEVERYHLEDSFSYEEQYYVILSNDEQDAVLFRIDDPDNITEFVRPTEQEFERIKEVYYESE